MCEVMGSRAHNLKLIAEMMLLLLLTVLLLFIFLSLVVYKRRMLMKSVVGQEKAGEISVKHKLGNKAHHKYDSIDFKQVCLDGCP